MAEWWDTCSQAVFGASLFTFDRRNKHLPELINAGKIKPLPRKHIEGGLSGVPQGLDYLRTGKASAEKVTFTFSESTTSHL